MLKQRVLSSFLDTTRGRLAAARMSGGSECSIMILGVKIWSLQQLCCLKPACCSSVFPFY